MPLADQLLALRADIVLGLAAERGLIEALSCQMEDCVCPLGREYFEPKQGRNPWAPSADHFPIPARDGGPLTPENVRLAHWRCNYLQGARFLRGSNDRLHSERDADGKSLHAKRMGTLYGRTAGLASAASRTPQERRELSSKAAHAAQAQRTAEEKQRIGRIAACVTNHLNRNRPCVCGSHT